MWAGLGYYRRARFLLEVSFTFADILTFLFINFLEKDLKLHDNPLPSLSVKFRPSSFHESIILLNFPM